MARISYEQPASEEAPVIAPAPKIKKRKKRPLRIRMKRGCCLLLFLAIAASGLVGTAALAKTGLWTVPGFSNFFYRLPEPSKTIKIGDPSTYQPEGGLVKDPDRPDRMKLEVTEKDLTYFLRRIFTGKKDSYLAENLQAVIADGEIELFALLLRPAKTNITVRIKPAIAENQISYSVASFVVGNLNLPPAWGQRLSEMILKDELDALNSYLARNFTVYSLSLGEGRLISELSLNQQLIEEYLKIINISR